MVSSFNVTNFSTFCQNVQTFSIFFDIHFSLFMCYWTQGPENFLKGFIIYGFCNFIGHVIAFNFLI